MKYQRYLLVLALIIGFYSCSLSELMPNNYSVSGTLLMKDGTPVSSAVITFEGSESYTGVSDSSGNYRITDMKAGNYSVKAVKYGNALVPDIEEGRIILRWNTSESVDFTGWDSDNLPINAIQGSGHTSPLKNCYVYNIEGIVTIIYQNDFKGFFIQSTDDLSDADSGTSEGIFIQASEDVDAPWISTVPLNLAVGDKVRVSGVVKEVQPEDYLGYKDGFLTLTMISQPIVEILSSGNTLPTPLTIGLGGTLPPYESSKANVDFWESYEGMRVTLEAPLVVGGISYGNIPVVLNNGDLAARDPDSDLTDVTGILLEEKDDNPERAFIFWEGYSDVVLSGSTFNNGEVTGVVAYSGDGIYTINPQSSADIGDITIPSHTKDSTNLSSSATELTVAVYNVENFGPTYSSGDSGDYDDRNDKAADLADDIVNRLGAPDILILVEMGDDHPTEVLFENTKNTYYVPDGYTSAAGNAAALISAIESEDSSLTGSYKYVDIPPEDAQEGGKPGMNIRVGFLYRQNRVGFQGTGEANFDDQTGVLLDDNGRISLTQNPGRIQDNSFRHSRRRLVGCFEFQGENIIVIGAHLKSKGGDSATYGSLQPPVNYSEVGRKEQAKALSSFVELCLGVDPDAAIIVAGDMNDFAYSDAVKEISRTGELSSLTEDWTLFSDGASKAQVHKDTYTYSYYGNAQQIDHTFVSSYILDNLDPKVDIVHINADYGWSDQHSDHDPIVSKYSF